MAGWSRTPRAADYLLVDAVHPLQQPVLEHEGVDAVDHALHELHLGVAQPVLVGDVVGDAWARGGVQVDRASQEKDEKTNLSGLQTRPWCRGAAPSAPRTCAHSVKDLKQIFCQ